MNILIPMAGAGSRFTEKGYKQHKPVLPITDRHTGEKIPMVVAAVRDLPFVANNVENKLIFIIRDFHAQANLDKQIKEYFPRAEFIVIDRLTEGQASTCLLAKQSIDTDEPLLIAACDNGMELTAGLFEVESAKTDALIFTFRGNEAVEQKPQAYGWVKTAGANVIDVSVKVPISTTPLADHAIVGTFWFKRGRDFVQAAETMIAANDRINGEFYVDQAMRHLVKAGLTAKVLEDQKIHMLGAPPQTMKLTRTRSLIGTTLS